MEDNNEFCTGCCMDPCTCSIHGKPQSTSSCSSQANKRHNDEGGDSGASSTKITRSEGNQIEKPSSSGQLDGDTLQISNDPKSPIEKILKEVQEFILNHPGYHYLSMALKDELQCTAPKNWEVVYNKFVDHIKKIGGSLNLKNTPNETNSVNKKTTTVSPNEQKLIHEPLLYKIHQAQSKENGSLLPSTSLQDQSLLKQSCEVRKAESDSPSVLTPAEVISTTLNQENTTETLEVAAPGAHEQDVPPKIQQIDTKKNENDTVSSEAVIPTTLNQENTTKTISQQQVDTTKVQHKEYNLRRKTERSDIEKNLNDTVSSAAVIPTTSNQENTTKTLDVAAPVADQQVVAPKIQQREYNLRRNTKRSDTKKNGNETVSSAAVIPTTSNQENTTKTISHQQVNTTKVQQREYNLRRKTEPSDIEKNRNDTVSSEATSTILIPVADIPTTSNQGNTAKTVAVATPVSRHKVVITNVQKLENNFRWNTERSDIEKNRNVTVSSAPTSRMLIPAADIPTTSNQGNAIKTIVVAPPVAHQQVLTTTVHQIDNNFTRNIERSDIEKNRNVTVSSAANSRMLIPAADIPTTSNQGNAIKTFVVVPPAAHQQVLTTTVHQIDNNFGRNTERSDIERNRNVTVSSAPTSRMLISAAVIPTTSNQGNAIKTAHQQVVTTTVQQIDNNFTRNIERSDIERNRNVTVSSAANSRMLISAAVIPTTSNQGNAIKTVVVAPPAAHQQVVTTTVQQIDNNFTRNIERSDIERNRNVTVSSATNSRMLIPAADIPTTSNQGNAIETVVVAPPAAHQQVVTTTVQQIDNNFARNTERSDIERNRNVTVSSAPTSRMLISAAVIPTTSNQGNAIKSVVVAPPAAHQQVEPNRNIIVTSIAASRTLIPSSQGVTFADTTRHPTPTTSTTNAMASASISSTPRNGIEFIYNSCGNHDHPIRIIPTNQGFVTVSCQLCQTVRTEPVPNAVEIKTEESEETDADDEYEDEQSSENNEDTETIQQPSLNSSNNHPIQNPVNRNSQYPRDNPNINSVRQNQNCVPPSNYRDMQYDQQHPYQNPASWQAQSTYRDYSNNMMPENQYSSRDNQRMQQMYSDRPTFRQMDSVGEQYQYLPPFETIRQYPMSPMQHNYCPYQAQRQMSDRQNNNYHPYQSQSQNRQNPISDRQDNNYYPYQPRDCNLRALPDRHQSSQPPQNMTGFQNPTDPNQYITIQYLERVFADYIVALKNGHIRM